MNWQTLQEYILPILVLGFIAWRFFKFKKIKAQIPHLLRKGAVVIDVRTPAKYQSGSSPGSINIPLNELASRSAELDKSKTIILCCASGTRSSMATGILKKSGFKNVMNAGPWTNTLS